MSEIEEFLRRAAALRDQQAKQRSAPPPVAASPIRAAKGLHEVLDAEVLEDDAVSGEDVSQHVQSHLSTREFVSRAQHAAETIRAADDEMEAHLHQTFEHRLGSLGATTSRAEDMSLDADEEAAKSPTSSGPAILSLLRSPQDLRNAIVLSELMNPPRHRW